MGDMVVLKYFKSHMTEITLISYTHLTYKLTAGKMCSMLKDKESDSCSLESQQEMPTGKDRKQVAKFFNNISKDRVY